MANFDWAEYLYISENLLGVKTQSYSEEAVFGVAISRSYYATLIKARNYLETKQNVRFGTDTSLHSAVINWFLKQKKRNLKQIGWRLHDLRDWRNIADYEDNFGGVKKRAFSAVRIARITVNQIAQL